MNIDLFSRVRRTHLLVQTALLLMATAALVHAQATSNFYNVVIPNGADPSVVRHTDGWIYRTISTGSNVRIWRTHSLSGMGAAESKTIWTPPAGTAYSSQLWAPELFFYNNKWYVYVAASDGTNANHRMYVLESAGADPFSGTWTFKGKMTDSTDRWAIDGTVFAVNGQLYTIWSGWVGTAANPQNLYIASMSTPWTINSARVQISTPTYSWETSQSTINEGPEVIVKNGKINVVYSANASWTNSYCLGLLTASTSSNLLSASSWTKKSTAVFSSGNGIYGPGHHSFAKSPDGTEDWIVYHCARYAGSGWDREVRIQKFTWNSDNTPDFGSPVGHDTLYALPSGEIEHWRHEAENASLGGGPGISSVSTASNGKYVTLDSTAESITFNVNVPVAGSYALTIRAADTSLNDSNASVYLSVNGGSNASQPIIDGSSTNWTQLGTRITLNAGANTIRLTKNANNSQVDAIQLQPYDAAAAISGRTFRLTARHSGLSVDVWQAATANDSPIAQANWNGGNNQRWVINSVGVGQYTFTGVASGRVIEVYNYASGAGTQLSIRDYAGGPNQKWRIAPINSGGFFKLTIQHSGQVMDVGGASMASGAAINQSTWNGGDNQKWKFNEL